MLSIVLLRADLDNFLLLSNMKKLEDSGIDFALMLKSVSATSPSRLEGKLICFAFPFGCVGY